MVEVELSVGGSVRGTPENVALVVSIDQRMQAEERDAVAALREQGVKAAHPDDGWVDRERNTVRLEYPAFNDRPQVGDLIALGWPRDGYRIVRVTELKYLQSTDLRVLSAYGMRRDEPWCYHFELLVEPAPERPARPWWKRWPHAR